MSQITLYLDDATQALIERSARANGLSKSRWVAEIIQKYAAHEWPADCLALAGSFADFPLRDDRNEDAGASPDGNGAGGYAQAHALDLPRVGF